MIIIPIFQYNCFYDNNIILSPLKEKSIEELIKNIMRDERFDFDLS